MTVDFPPMDIGALLQFVVLILGLASVYGALRQDLRNIKETQKLNTEAVASFIALNLDGRVKAVEAHGDKVDQIGPLVERVAQFERRFESAFESMRDDARELARTVRELTQAAFSKARQ